MPYADNNGVRIHYHVEGQGPPLIMQHGFSGSLHGWHDSGYVKPLKQEYTLILTDTRGHGLSDKPHDPKDFDMALKVGDVTAVLDDLNIDKAHYMGYSLGGRAGYGVAKYAPERFHSIIIGGMHPYGNKRGGGDTQSRIDLLKKGMEAYIAEAEAERGPMPPERRARMLASDPESLIASSIELRDFTGIEEVLPTMTMPCLLFMGEEDGLYPDAKEAARHMPNVTFVSFPGLNHGQTSQSSHLVLPHVFEFLKSAVHQASAAD